MLKHIPFYSSLIGRTLFNKEKAGISHVLVYGAIEAHSMGEKGCIASNERIAEETGTTPSTVSKAISQLKAAGWIDTELTSQNKRLSITPLLEISALPPSKAALPGSNAGLYPAVKIYNRVDYSKEIDKSISKKTPTTDKYTAEDVEIVELLRSQIATNFPYIKDRPPRVADYEEINKLHRIDGKDYELIKGVILWSQQDEFWKKVIRSPVKLRKKFDDLQIYAQEWFNKKSKQRIVEI